MSNLQKYYTCFLSLLHEIEPKNNFIKQIRKPKLSDKELIALSLAAEASGIDSELLLFQQLPDDLLHKIERSVYNKRRRRLSLKTQELQQRLANAVIAQESHLLIDSMPIEICRPSRAKRSRVCSQHDESSPDFGYCAAQKMYYFGYKIHAVCTHQGVFKAFDLTKASTHDIHYLNDVREQFDHCILIGDKGYLSRAWQADLFEHSAISLCTPLKRNQTTEKPLPAVYRKARKRIETLFSQLCDQFMIRRNYAKSFAGLATRVVAKITALTIIQLHNKNLGRNINRLKMGFP